MAVFMLSGLSAQDVLFVGEEVVEDVEIVTEAEIVANIEAAGYTVTTISGTEFAGYAEGDFDDYDVVIIGESISSGDATNFGAIGFPIPVICLEPYVLHKDGWEFYGESYIFDASTVTEDAYDMTILDGTHPIFTGLDYTAGDEIGWVTDSEEGAHLLGMPVGDGPMGDNATPLADNNFIYDQTGEGFAFMWAIEADATTPRMFLWGIHERYLPHRSDAFDQIILNALQWVRGVEVSVAEAKANEAVSSLNISPNPAVTNTQVYINAAASGIAEISVIDLSGNEISSDAVNMSKGVNSYNLPVEMLKSGLYFVSVELNGKKFVEKLIVK